DSAESGVEGGRTASSLSTQSTNRIDFTNFGRESYLQHKNAMKNNEAPDQIQSQQRHKTKSERRAPRERAERGREEKHKTKSDRWAPREGTEGNWEETDPMRANVTSILLPPDRVILRDTDEENSMSQYTFKDQQTLESAAQHVNLSHHELESVASSAGKYSAENLKQDVNYGTLTSEDSSPRLKSNAGSSGWQSSEPSAASGSQNLQGWQHPTKKFERLYQDCQGTLHIAHQPPGYTDDRDSHSSESMSDQENHQNDEDAEDGRRRVSAAAWSSSVSESAYETIRERHRHVDEALASSFEFYSTSPRDARRLGYVSSEAERGQGGEDSSEASVSELFGAAATATSTRNGSNQNQHSSVSGHHLQGSSGSLRTSASTSRRPSSHRYHQYPQKKLTSVSSNGNSSMEGDRSSQVEFIKKQKQKHMTKIQKHIHTLEKLERDLMNELGENLGSERSIRRHVTEGRSNTESDTNKPRFRNILGQSGTATSSIISTDLSDDAKGRQPNTYRPDVASRSSLSQRHDGAKISGKLARTVQGSNKRPDRQLPMAKLLLKKVNTRSVSTDSQTSTPRLPVSRMSSRHPSSEYISPGISLVENEVKHLLSIDEWTKIGITTSKDFASSSEYPSRPDPGSQGSAIHTMQREEPRGEEDPRRKQQTQVKKFNNMLPVAKQISESSETISENSNSRSPRKSSKEISQRSSIKSYKARENDVTDVSDTHVSRQGDGREERDGAMTIIPVVQPVSRVSNQKPFSQSKSGYVRKSSSEKAKTSTNGSIRSSKKCKNVPLKDFSQMFPSVESVAALESESNNEEVIDRLSVGIQTSASLLCINENNDKLFTKNTKTISQGIQAVLPTSTNDDLSTNIQQNTTSATDKKSQTHDNKKESEKSVDNTNNLLSTNHNNLKDIKSQEKHQALQHDTAGIPNESHANLNHSGKVMSRNHSPSISQNKNKTTSQQSKQVLKTKTFTEKGQQYSLQYETDSNNSHQELESQRSNYQDAKLQTMSKQPNSTYLNTVRCDTHQPYQHRAELTVTNQKESHRSEKLHFDNNDLISDIQSQGNLTSSTVYYEVPSIIPGQRKETNYRSQSARQAPISSARQPKTRPQSAADQRIQNSQQMLLNLGDGARNKRSQQQIKRPENSQVNIAKVQDQSKRVITIAHSNRAIGLVQNIDDMLLEEDTRSDNEVMQITYKKPVRFNVSATKINISEGDIYSATDKNDSEEKEGGTTLQDALLSAHPGYLRSAENRRLQIRLKAALRKQAQEHNHQVLAQVPPNLQTPSTLKRFLYKPEVKPLFTYKDIRNQNARLYQLLPEAQAPLVQGKRGAMYRTNRIMANMYSTRLRKKVLAGKTNHAHLEVITPMAT
ncbi:unnamed protein product, partial [Meganyctiphanes norvegica]